MDIMDMKPTEALNLCRERVRQRATPTAPCRAPRRVAHGGPHGTLERYPPAGGDGPGARRGVRLVSGSGSDLEKKSDATARAGALVGASRRRIPAMAIT